MPLSEYAIAYCRVLKESLALPENDYEQYRLMDELDALWSQMSVEERIAFSEGTAEECAAIEARRAWVTRIDGGKDAAE